MPSRLNLFSFFLLLTFLAVIKTSLNAQNENVGIGTNSPDSTAILDVTSNKKGMLIPRMSSEQRRNIERPATGLIVYDIDNSSFWYYNELKWVRIADLANVQIPGIDPQEKGSKSVWGPIWIVKSNNLMYVSAFPPSEIVQFDISDPENPIITGSFNTTIKPRAIAIENNLLYVVDNFGRKIEIIDVSDIDAIQILATIPTNGNILPDEINVINQHIFIGDGNFTEIYDATNPSMPIFLKEIKAGPFSIVGNLGYASGDSLKIFDISDPSNPNLLSKTDVAFNYITVFGKYLYGIANTYFKCFDISNPVNPVEISNLNMSSPGSRPISYNNGIVLIPDQDKDTVFLVDVTDVNNPTRVGDVTSYNITFSIPNGNYIYVAESSQSKLLVFKIADLNALGIDHSGRIVEIQGFDNQTLTFDESAKSLLIENGNLVDLTPLVNDGDFDASNELITNIVLNGSNLEITDAGGINTADLSVLIDDADNNPTNEYLLSATLNGNNLQLTDGGGTKSVNLSSLINDADSNPTNELLLSASLNGSNLLITDIGGTKSVDLSPLSLGNYWTKTGNDLSYDLGHVKAGNLTLNKFNSALTDIPGSGFGSQLIGSDAAHIVVDVRANDLLDGFHIRLPTSPSSSIEPDKAMFSVNAKGIGIKTSNPQAELDVRGKTNLNGDLEILGLDPILEIKKTTPLNTTGVELIGRITFSGQKNNNFRPAAYIDVNKDATWSTNNLNFAPTAISFYLQSGGEDNGLLLPKMKLNSNGDLTIGAIAANGHRLSVDGKIACEEVRVEMSENWPDYVFTPEYLLPTIKEVKKYIVTEGRLPGMPSAIEVEENGLEIGEMQRKMMEKIEELTLYIIEQEERMVKMEEEIMRLKNK